MFERGISSSFSQFIRSRIDARSRLNGNVLNNINATLSGTLISARRFESRLRSVCIRVATVTPASAKFPASQSGFPRVIASSAADGVRECDPRRSRSRVRAFGTGEVSERSSLRTGHAEPVSKPSLYCAILGLKRRGAHRLSVEHPENGGSDMYCDTLTTCTPENIT